MKRMMSWIMLFCVLCLAGTAQAVKKNVLHFGNSYSRSIFTLTNLVAHTTNEIHAVVLRGHPETYLQSVEADIAGTDLYTYAEAVAAGPAEAAEHGWLALENAYAERVMPLTVMQSTNWDVVAMQPHSSTANQINSWKDEFDSLHAHITNYCPGATVSFYHTTQYRNDGLMYTNESNTGHLPRTRPGETYLEDQHWLDVHEATIMYVNEREDSFFINGGTAVQNARYDPDWLEVFPDPAFDYQSGYPEIPDESRSLHLGLKWNSSADWDWRLDSHPNDKANYLNACVWYEMLFAESAEGNPYVPEDMTSNECAVLQRIAHETVLGKLPPSVTNLINLTTQTVSFVEGQSGTFQFRLDEMVPTYEVAPGPLTVRVSRASGDTNVTVPISEFVLTSLSYSNWNTVTINAASDDGAGLSNGATLYVEIPLIELYAEVDVQLADGIITDQSEMSVPEGNSSTLKVKLSYEPASPVTVAVARVTGGDTDLAVDGGSSLVFNSGNWAVYQDVTISAEPDVDFLDGTATIRCSADGLDDLDVAVSENDDENDPLYSLPWTETFETSGTNAGTLGNLHDQHGWTVSPTHAATVQSAEKSEGAQGCELGDGDVIHAFTDDRTNVELSFDLKPHFAEEAMTIPTDASAVFFVNANGNITAYSNSTPVVISGTTLQADTWYTFTVSSDYSSDTWALDVDGTNVLSHFDFYANGTVLNTFMVRNEELSAVYLDNLSFAEATTDADGDGLPDWWEITHYGSTNISSGAMASNGVNTVGGAYIAGLNPTNENAFFALTDLQGGAVNTEIYWTGVSGRVYSVYWTSNLLSGFGGAPVESNIAWTVTPYTDTNHPGDVQGFYKIEVELE